MTPHFGGSRILEGLQRLYSKLHSFSQLVQMLQISDESFFFFFRILGRLYPASSKTVRHHENIKNLGEVLMCTASDAAAVIVEIEKKRSVIETKSINS